MKALVISGGGSKGAFAGGVAQYLIKDLGYNYDLYLGTSTGSLLVPHLVRPMVGHNYHLLIPISALAGAALVSWSDALSRAIAFPTETPVGVITALVGTPCFILIATRRS